MQDEIKKFSGRAAVVGGIAGVIIAAQQPDATGGFVLVGLIGGIIAGFGIAWIFSTALFIVLSILAVIISIFIRHELIDLGQDIVDKVTTSEARKQWFYFHGICITNVTNDPVKFYLKWGEASWNLYELPPNHSFGDFYYFGHNDGTPPTLNINYDYSFTDGYQEQSHELELGRISRYNKDRGTAEQTFVCDDLKNYHFALYGQGVRIFSAD